MGSASRLVHSLTQPNPRFTLNEPIEYSDLKRVVTKLKRIKRTVSQLDSNDWYTEGFKDGEVGALQLAIDELTSLLLSTSL